MAEKAGGSEQQSANRKDKCSRVSSRIRRLAERSKIRPLAGISGFYRHKETGDRNQELETGINALPLLTSSVSRLTRL